jgi:hypothetical protein
MVVAPPKRPRGRPFPKGTSGNPAGLKPGTRHRATMMAEAMMAGDLEAVIGRVIRAAKMGDMGAAKLIIDRLVPLRKGRATKFEMAPISTAADVVAAQASIAEIMAAGELSPAEAFDVAGIVELQRKAIETAELDTRIAQLERRVGTDDDQKL